MLEDSFTPVQGVQWCPVHHGIFDECSDQVDHCDNNPEGVSDVDGRCLRADLFIRSGDVHRQDVA